jgi:hypothetical protein
MSKRYGGIADRAELIDAIQAVRYGLWFEHPPSARLEGGAPQVASPSHTLPVNASA